MICALETKLNKLSESNRQVTALPTMGSDVKIIFYAAPQTILRNCFALEKGI